MLSSQSQCHHLSLKRNAPMTRHTSWKPTHDPHITGIAKTRTRDTTPRLTPRVQTSHAPAMLPPIPISRNGANFSSATAGCGVRAGVGGTQGFSFRFIRIRELLLFTAYWQKALNAENAGLWK